MDKVTLNDEQLCKVIDFIESRGFHDPGVVVEILDHFSCKVEEKMSAAPKLTLEEAMTDAHYEFGKLGFYPLLANYEANTRKKYRTLYRAERNKVLTNPLYVIPGLLSALAVYKAFGWSEMNGGLLGVNLAVWLIYGAFITFFVLMAIKFKIVKKRNKISEAIMSGDVILAFMFVGVISQSGEHTHAKSVIIFSALSAFTWFMIVMRSLSLFNTLKAGQREYDFVNGYLAQKGATVL